MDEQAIGEQQASAGAAGGGDGAYDGNLADVPLVNVLTTRAWEREMGKFFTS